MHELGIRPYYLQTSNPSTYCMLTFGCLYLNQYHQLLHGIPSENDIALIYVSFVIIIFNCCKLMDNPHSCIANVHVITTTYSSSISTPHGPIFLYLVFPCKWSTREFIVRFHELLAFLRECVPLSITAIVTSNLSSIHMPLLVFKNIWFNCGAIFLFCGSRVRGRFSLLVVRSVTC